MSLLRNLRPKFAIAWAALRESVPGEQSQPKSRLLLPPTRRAWIDSRRREPCRLSIRSSGRADFRKPLLCAREDRLAAFFPARYRLRRDKKIRSRARRL